MEDKKNIKFYNIKAILIILIVFTSSIYSFNFNNSYLVSNITKIIYAFMMPILCIITGYYSRSKLSSKHLIRLFSMFMIINFIFYIYEYFSTGFITSTIIKYSSWYLVDLVIWKLVYKQINNKPMAFISCMVGVSLLTIIPNDFNILNIDNMIYYFSFFLLGSCFNIFNEEDKNKKKAIISLIVSLLVISIVILLCKFDISFYNKLYCENGYLLIVRLLFYVCVYFIFYNLFVLVPDKKIKYFTDIGINYLTIYVLSPLFTIIFSNMLHDNKFIILWGIIFTSILCLILSNKYINKGFKYFIELFMNWYSWIVLLAIISLTVIVYFAFNSRILVNNNELNYNIVSNDNINDIKNRSISIGFSSNIVLLEKGLKNNYDGNEYNFDNMFKYVKEYYKNTDYIISMVEGISDDKNEYTLHNDMNKKINVDSSIFKSLKNNNIDLVSLSNQHILDYGEDGIKNTLSNVKKNNIDSVGLYSDKDDKKYKIVDIEGINVGIISYTFIPDGWDENDIYNNYDEYANFLCDIDSRRFDKVKKDISNSFNSIHNDGAEIIVVLVNDSYYNEHGKGKKQEEWNKIFSEYGADIVFGSYSSSVQEIEYINDTVVINSNGSFINNEYGDDNDLSYITKVYVDKDRKDINSVSIIPVYSYKNSKDGYVALPIYDGLRNKDIKDRLSQNDIDRMKDGVSIVTKNAFGEELSSDILENEYYYFTDGYKRQLANKMELSNEELKSKVYSKLSNSKKTCYVGDQYTTGSKNGGFGWFEPLVSTIGNEYVRISNSGYTSGDAVNNYKDIMNNSNCDLYVVALGSNDIRNNYLNVDDYINNISTLVKDVKKDIIMVAPWQPLEIEYQDNNKYKEDMELFLVYNKRLKKYCDEEDCIYVNPNAYISEILEQEEVSNYYNGYYYPNSNMGIELFSRSILH